MDEQVTDFTQARMVVAGAGPIGGIVGGRLARAGHDVTLVDVNLEHVAAIRQRGLYVEVPDGPFTVPANACLPREAQGPFDLAFIAVRSNYTRDVLAWLEPSLTPTSTVVSLQNGVNPPWLEEHFGPDRVIGTSIRMYSFRVAPGHVKTEQRGQLYVGRMDGRVTPALRGVHALLDSVIPTEITENLLGKLWSKLTYTCLTTITSLSTEPRQVVWAAPERRRLCIETVREVVRTGLAAGVTFLPLREYEPLAFVHGTDAELEQVLAPIYSGPHGVSFSEGVAGKLMRGERTEVDHTVAYVVEQGERHGVPTPVCAALLQVVHEIEQGHRPMSLQNHQDLTAALHPASPATSTR